MTIITGYIVMRDNDKNSQNQAESEDTSKEPGKIKKTVFDGNIEQIDDSELPQSLKDKFKWRQDD
jgi:hypothetical protein